MAERVVNGMKVFCIHRNAEIEAQIAHLRAELLHKEQENDRVQLQLTQEKEERERAQRKVTYTHPSLHCVSPLTAIFLPGTAVASRNLSLQHASSTVMHDTDSTSCSDSTIYLL